MAEDKFQKRQIAYKARISDILNGIYVKEEGWTPNYIQINKEKFSRINLLGAVLAVEDNANFQSAVIDDGSGKIAIRTFEKSGMFDRLKIGDIVIVVGRPREYASERYILAEIIRKIDNPLWLKIRGLELENVARPVKMEHVEEKKEVIAEELIVDDAADRVLEFIKTSDRGEGVSYEDVLNVADDEKLIDNLLKHGEIFEIKPGYLKILE